LPQCRCERFLFIIVHLLPTSAFELLDYHTVEREHKENFPILLKFLIASTANLAPIMTPQWLIA
jgi:hypothetical protein